MRVVGRAAGSRIGWLTSARSEPEKEAAGGVGAAEKPTIAADGRLILLLAGRGWGFCGLLELLLTGTGRDFGCAGRAVLV